MRFNEVEVRFLRGEHAMAGLRPIRDLRELGCPARIFEKILDQRARKLGPLDTLRVNAAPATDDLDQRISASKLW